MQFNRLIRLGAIAMTLTGMQAASAQTVLRVDAQNGLTTGAGATGADWAHAYKYLQDALAQTGSGSFELWLADGDYHTDRSSANPSGTGSRTATFTLVEDVEIYGGFHGDPSGETLRSQRNPQTNVANLTGDINTANTHTDNSYHVVTANDTDLNDSNSLVDGVTIRYGYGNGTSSGQNQGAGAYCTNGADPRFHDCTFTLNTVVAGGVDEALGAGACSIDCSPVFTVCEFKGNTAGAGGSGGGFGAGDDGDPKLIDCNIGENVASWGGGVAAKDSTRPLLLNCLIADNETVNPSGSFLDPAAGGGVSMDRGSSIEIINCTIA